MFKRLLHKFNHFMYRYHRKKMYKYMTKSIGGKRYLMEKTQLSSLYGSSVYADIKKAFNSGETHGIYADTDSVSAYPSVMKPCRFPLVNQPGSK